MVSLRLNLNEDEELRDVVKEMIEGQIRGIVRSEVSEIINAELSRIIASRPLEARLDGIIKERVVREMGFYDYKKFISDHTMTEIKAQVSAFVAEKTKTEQLESRIAGYIDKIVKGDTWTVKMTPKE